MSRAASSIRRERRGRDVYVIGAANVGKSAFIRSLVKQMSSASGMHFDPMAAAKLGYLPTESPMPGTTLKLIPMEVSCLGETVGLFCDCILSHSFSVFETLLITSTQVFGSGGVLYDTPGLHLHHRTPHLLTPDENKALHPRKVSSETIFYLYLLSTSYRLDFFKESLSINCRPILIPYPAYLILQKLRAYVAPPLVDVSGTGLLQAAELEGDEIPGAPAQQPRPDFSRPSITGDITDPISGIENDDVLDDWDAEGLPSGSSGQASYLWSGLARIDVLQGPPTTQLVFYGPPALRVSAVPLLGQNGGGGEGAQPNTEFGVRSVANRGGIKLAKQVG